MDIKRTGVRQRKQRRQIYIGAAALAVAAVLGFTVFNVKPPAPNVSQSQVWIDQVQQGEMLREVRGTGVLVPREVRWIAAQSPGRARAKDPRGRALQHHCTNDEGMIQSVLQLPQCRS